MAVKMRDESEQANDEEARDVRRAPLFEQKVDADAQIDQSDQRQVKAALYVRITLLQTLQVGQPFLDHHVALIVAAFHIVDERHRIGEPGLVSGMIDVKLYVLGLLYVIEFDAVLADRQKRVAAINAGQSGRAAGFDSVSDHAEARDVAPEDAVAVDGLLVQSIA